MRSNLAFLVAAIAAGSCLVFSAAKAQALPTVLQTVWIVSTRLTYDPLLVATFILSMTLAIGRTVDLVREHRQRTEQTAA